MKFVETNESAILLVWINSDTRPYRTAQNILLKWVDCFLIKKYISNPCKHKTRIYQQDWDSYKSFDWS